MYKLQSSDKTNGHFVAALETNPEFLKELSSKWTPDMLRYFIFHEEVNEKQFKILGSTLSCGDNLGTPLLESEARFLWFVLCVNFAHYNKEIGLKISTPVHAKYLYDLCEGEYKNLDLENDHSEKKHREAYCRFLARHTCLYPEKNIYWEIPVSFYKNHCMVAGAWATFAIATIGDTKVKIPRSIFLKFFASSISEGKVVANDSKEIRLFFDESISEPVWDTLKYMGYNLHSKIIMHDGVDYYYDDNMDKGLCAHLLNKTAVLWQNEEEKVYWNEIQPNTYHYLRRDEEYVPTKPIGNIIYVYKN